MIRSRAGWKIVTLLVALLLLRTIAATFIETRIASADLIAWRLVCLVAWIVVLVCIALGLEWARFAAVMLLSLGTACAVALLLDPVLLPKRVAEQDLTLVRADLLVFAVTNLAFVPLLAFSKPVRNYFAKVPNSAHF